MSAGAVRRAPEAGWWPRADVHTAFLPPEAVLFDEATGHAHRLNSGASSVWMVLEGQRSAAQIADDLAEIYEVDPSVLRGEVERALAEFAEHGWIEDRRDGHDTSLSPEHAGPAASGSPEAPAADAEGGAGEAVDVLPRPPDP